MSHSKVRGRLRSICKLLHPIVGSFAYICQLKSFFNPNHPPVVKSFMDILPLQSMKRCNGKAICMDSFVLSSNLHNISVHLICIIIIVIFKIIL